MTRSQATSSPHRALPAFVAWLVTLLQVLGALHFALIPHTFSAALGGVVHVHADQRAHAQGRPRRGLGAERAVSLVSDAASCSADSCPVADAPAGSVLPSPALEAGWVSFGDASLLAERSQASAAAQRIFLSAPKTSPPV